MVLVMTIVVIITAHTIMMLMIFGEILFSSLKVLIVHIRSKIFFHRFNNNE